MYQWKLSTIGLSIYTVSITTFQIRTQRIMSTSHSIETVLLKHVVYGDINRKHSELPLVFSVFMVWSDTMHTRGFLTLWFVVILHWIGVMLTSSVCRHCRNRTQNNDYRRCLQILNHPVCHEKRRGSIMFHYCK